MIVEALEMLRFEPDNSAEGQLRKRFNKQADMVKTSLEKLSLKK